MFLTNDQFPVLRPPLYHSGIEYRLNETHSFIIKNMSMNDLHALCTLFDKYAHMKSDAAAFDDLLDAFLLPFRLFDSQEERESQLQQIISFPKNENLASFFLMLGELSEGFSDPLGDVYMEKVSKGRLGQFFTPEHVCDLIAQITIGTVEDGKTVLDPACGSGRMLLAAAKLNRNMLLFGADVDKTCCKMAVANMVLHSLSGEIAHMDSLSNQFFTGYHIGNTLFDGYYYPWYREFTEPEKSFIWLQPPMKAEKSATETIFVFPANGVTKGALF